MTVSVESPDQHDSGIITLAAYQQSEAPAVIIPATDSSESQEISYKELHHAVCRLRQELGQLGLDIHSRLALALPNGIEFVVCFFAGAAQGAPVAPINPAYKPQEAQALLERIKPKMLLASPQSAAAWAGADMGVPVASCSWDAKARCIRLELPESMPHPRPVHLCQVSPDDDALMLFTSGTTGTPKGVMLTHRNLLVAVQIIVRAQGLSPTDRCAIVTPLFHVAGVGMLLLSTLLSGGAAVIPSSVSGAFWSQLREHAVTWYHGVPTLHRLLLTFPRPSDLGRLRFVSSGGSSLAEDTLQRLEAELGRPVLERYGMTETAPGIFCNKIDQSRRSSCYPVAPEITVRILHSSGEGKRSLTDRIGVSGEICVKGENVMSGYLDNAAANADSFVDGFFRTGDLGLIEPDGYLRIVGRLKEIINKGGEKIDPTEVEHILLKHESIRDVACFRVADELYGEDIGRFPAVYEVYDKYCMLIRPDAGVAIVLHEGRELKALQVKKYVRDNAVGFKVPKKVRVFPDWLDGVNRLAGSLSGCHSVQPDREIPAGLAFTAIWSIGVST